MSALSFHIRNHLLTRKRERNEYASLTNPAQPVAMTAQTFDLYGLSAGDKSAP